MLPQPTNDHWLLLSLGLVAMFARLGFSFVCAAFLVLGPEATQTSASVSSVNEVGPVIAIFALAIALNIIQVFIHEMGHALAAWSVGRRVHMICVGILGYAPDLKKLLRVKIPANAEYAGYVQVSPVWPDLSPGKSIWISAGGPLATGVLGLLILAGAALSGPIAPAVLWLVGFFLLDALVNLIPLRWTMGGASDGLHILGYLGGKGWTAEQWAKTRLEMAELSPQLVSDAEWSHLKPLVGAPFNSKALDKLLEKATAQRDG